MGVSDHLCGTFPTALHPVPAERVFGLRSETNVAQDGDAACGEVCDGVCHVGAAFDFDGVGAGFFHESGGGGECLFGGVLVGPKGQVGDDEGAVGAAGDGAGDDEHFVYGDAEGGGVAEDSVGCGVTDEEDGDACGVEDAGGHVVVGGEHGPFVAFGFPGLEVVGAHDAGGGAGGGVGGGRAAAAVGGGLVVGGGGRWCGGAGGGRRRHGAQPNAPLGCGLAGGGGAGVVGDRVSGVRATWR